jgi:hypothetical protein
LPDYWKPEPIVNLKGARLPIILTVAQKQGEIKSFIDERIQTCKEFQEYLQRVV